MGTPDARSRGTICGAPSHAVASSAQSVIPRVRIPFTFAAGVPLPVVMNHAPSSATPALHSVCCVRPRFSAKRTTTSGTGCASRNPSGNRKNFRNPVGARTKSWKAERLPFARKAAKVAVRRTAKKTAARERSRRAIRGSEVCIGTCPMNANRTGAPARREDWALFGAVDRAIVLMQVANVLEVAAPSLTPVQVLAAVCETSARYLSLRRVVLWSRVAGRSRTLCWDDPHTAAQVRRQSSTSVPEQPADDAPAPEGPVVASFSDARLGVLAMLYVQSARVLDEQDRVLLGEVLRRLMGPSGSATVRSLNG